MNTRTTGAAMLARLAAVLSFTGMLCVALAGSAGAQPPVARGSSEPDYFHALGKRVEIEVILDRVGVLLRDGVDAKRLQPRMSELGLELAGQYPRVALFGTGRALARRELVALMRRIEAEAGDFILQAGLVVIPKGAEVPMLAGDRLVASLKPGGESSIERIAERIGARVVMENPFVKGQWLLRLEPDTPQDSITVANRLHESGAVEYAQPDFIKPVFTRQVVLNDRLYADQWHLNNTGQGAGLAGADTRAAFAWQSTRGAAATVIAVIDEGFDAAHPDLVPNLWTNPGEVAGNGIDDADANPYIDDVNGWDFTGCDAAMPAANCGDNGLAGGNHGTAVAGAAAARGDNALGVSGSCPECSLMLLRMANSDFAQGLMFDYARTMGASVVTNSWGFGVGTPCTTTLCTAIDNAANNGRGGLGAVVLFAMNNPNVNDCGALPDISSLPTVIAVSRASNFDRFDLSGFGNCMDVLAPSAGTGTVAAGRGTLWITTTDRVGANGYNNAAAPASCPTAAAGAPPADARDYTACFNGTSAATPITAGVAGLIVTANGALTRAQVQNLLQDTADRIEDSAGAYALGNGFSAPAGGNATHGFGRINADEAVRVVAPAAQGGRAGVDVFLRDNRLDWGNMQRPSHLLFENPRGYIPHWHSVDIKVDSPVGGYRTPPTAATFDAFADESPSAAPGDVNRVYVRVRNRGPVTAANVVVKLHWAQFGTALPALPPDFWTAFPADSTDVSRWHPLDCSVAPPAPAPATVCALQNVAYSGSSVAATAGDAAQVARFEFPAPAIDPALANHFCLMAIVDSPQDPVSALSRTRSNVDNITPDDNNVTHRNYANLSSTRSRHERSFLVRNPGKETLRTILAVQAPRGWRVRTTPFAPGEAVTLRGGEERRVKIRIEPPRPGLTGEVTVTQLDARHKRPMGGVTFGIRPDVKRAP